MGKIKKAIKQLDLGTETTMSEPDRYREDYRGDDYRGRHERGRRELSDAVLDDLQREALRRYPHGVSADDPYRELLGIAAGALALAQRFRDRERSESGRRERW